MNFKPKRIRLFLLAAIAVFGLGNNVFAQAIDDVFTVNDASTGNLAMTFKITSLSPNEVRVGNDDTRAISTSTTGNLTIPSSVTGGTGTLTYSVTSIGYYAFWDCSGLTGDLVIPNSVTSIGGSAFRFCTGLTSVVIPNSVTTIGESAFSGCSGLTGSLTIPNSVTSIGSSAFSGCSGLTGTLTIPNSVTSIGSSAFAYCSGLTSLTIGNSVTSIGGYTFAECSGLTEITSLAVTPPTGYDCFISVPTTIPVHVPCESEAAYQSDYVWSEFTNYTDCIQTVGLNGIAEITNISLYPNPASDKITITCGEKINSIEVVDLLGKVVYQGKETAIDVSNLARGNYFVRVQTENGTITKKVIVE